MESHPSQRTRRMGHPQRFLGVKGGPPAQQIFDERTARIAPHALVEGIELGKRQKALRKARNQPGWNLGRRRELRVGGSFGKLQYRHSA